jgi:hypothetical protein
MPLDAPAPVSPPGMMPALVSRAPARTARILAMVLSIVAVGFSIGFGIYVRRLIPIFDQDHPERWVEPGIAMLVFLLFALLFRMGAALCELVWLERTWSNMPEELRRVGPLEKVSSGLAVVLTFVPGLAWLWKLGLAIAICDAFEHLRTKVPFAAKVPKRLGIAAVVVGWVPGLSVYIAPFLWEIFATKMDVVCNEIRASQS